MGASSSFTVVTWVNAAAGTTVVNSVTVEGGDHVDGNNTGKAELHVPVTGGLSPTGADLALLLLALGLIGLGALALVGSRWRAPRTD